MILLPIRNFQIELHCNSNGKTGEIFFWSTWYLRLPFFFFFFFAETSPHFTEFWVLEPNPLFDIIINIVRCVHIAHITYAYLACVCSIFLFYWFKLIEKTNLNNNNWCWCVRNDNMHNVNMFLENTYCPRSKIGGRDRHRHRHIIQILSRDVMFLVLIFTISLSYNCSAGLYTVHTAYTLQLVHAFNIFDSHLMSYLVLKSWFIHLDS